MIIHHENMMHNHFFPIDRDPMRDRMSNDLFNRGDICPFGTGRGTDHGLPQATREWNRNFSPEFDNRQFDPPPEPEPFLPPVLQINILKRCHTRDDYYEDDYYDPPPKPELADLLSTRLLNRLYKGR